MKISLTAQVISAVCAVTLIGPLGAQATENKNILQINKDAPEGQEKRGLTRRGRDGKKPEKEAQILSSVAVPGGFNRPAWALSTSTADDDEEARVFVTYKTNMKLEVKKVMNALDSQEQLSWSTMNTGAGRRPKPFSVEYDFPEMNSYVVTASKRKLKELMNQHGSKIEMVEEDLPREPQEFLGELSAEDLGEEVSDQKHRLLAQEVPYGINMVEAPLLWGGYGSVADSVTGSGVKVCVIDSGIQRSNPDFIEENLTGDDSQNGGAGQQSWFVDGCTHGTHCSGSIAAANNDEGVVGVAYDANIHSIKVFGSTGSTSCGWTYSSGLIDATNKCKAAGAKVISMSLGGGGYSANEAEHYQDLFDQGILIVAAAGNGGNDSYLYPASYPAIMSVAAVSSSGSKASFSQYNDQVDIAAPGVNVRSTVNNGYGNKSGTSMATPHVAGVAALLFEHFSSDDAPGDAIKIRNAMELTAEDRGDPGRDDQYGHGIVKAHRAFEWLDVNSAPTRSPSPTTSPAPSPGPPNVELDLLTDNYGGETSWKIIKVDTQVVVESKSGYASAQRYVEGYTLAPGDYLFRIEDSYGDGICCAYGTGSYTFSAEGSVVVTGGEFDEFEETPFTIDGISNPDPTASPTATPTKGPTAIPTSRPTTPPTKNPTGSPTGSPTSSPTAIPSSSPSERPTSTPTTSPTGTPTSSPTAIPSLSPSKSPIIGSSIPTKSPTSNPTGIPTVGPTRSPVVADPTASPTASPFGESFNVEIALKTDNFAGETSWTINDSITKAQVLSGSGYSNDNVYTETFWLNDGFYDFTIRDTWGDGICCGFGDGEYTLVVDGNVVATGGDFESSETIQFVIGDTAHPTTSPTKAPSPGGNWIRLEKEGFEEGWGAWNDGGSDARRSFRDGEFAHSGRYTIRLRDDSETSYIARDPMDVESYTKLKLSFWFFPRNMNDGESFLLEASKDDGDWEILKTYQLNPNSEDPNVVAFENGQFYSDTVEVTTDDVASLVWRIRCNASANNDFIYVDDIVIAGLEL